MFYDPVREEQDPLKRLEDINLRNIKEDEHS
jgi:hypothetical protein